MVRRTGPTNPLLRQLIQELRQKAKQLNAPIWLAVAEKLERPRRQRVEVNLSGIERYAKENETLVVPGVVLASGELKKSVRVAAWKFSTNARKKIEAAKGKCLAIQDLLKENPKGSGVRIIC